MTRLFFAIALSLLLAGCTARSPSQPAPERSVVIH